MDYDKLIEQLRNAAGGPEGIEMCQNAATALSTLQAENEKLRADLEQERAHRIHAEQHADAFQKDCERLNAELERVTAERDGAIRKYEAEKEDFLDYALSGTRNAAPFCRNRHPDCVDKRGWCIPVKCHGFSRDKED